MSDNADFISTLMASADEDFDFQQFFDGLPEEDIDDFLDVFTRMQVKALGKMKELDRESKVRGLAVGFSSMPLQFVQEAGALMLELREQD